MEAFEQFVALAMESEGLVVSSALKFPVKRRTRKVTHEEWQTHGFEVDLVGARADKLVLVTVKSFFGSRGVVAEHVRGESFTAAYNARYALLNDLHVRDTVVQSAAERFGFEHDQVEMRLYVGRFATRFAEEGVREWCSTQQVGSGPILVVGAAEVVKSVRSVAQSKQYRDNAVLATLKVLDATGALSQESLNTQH
ncbi:hypothetical protein [Pseudoclavibacter sp. JSM 162008]|uniref:hypothetical protein n=1 Tax=Pseudoclavibacter sp. JSM 162008 TaxID=3229855 RepID=UPI003525A672